jgi:hypothetical protein
MYVVSLAVKKSEDKCLHIAGFIRTWSGQIFAKRSDHNQVDTETKLGQIHSQTKSCVVERTEDEASQLQEPRTRQPQRRLQITSTHAGAQRTVGTHPCRHALASCPTHTISLTHRHTGISKQVQTAAGFKLIPPESKVMPLPTKAMG